MIVVYIVLGLLAAYQVSVAFLVQIGALVARIRHGRPEAAAPPSISLLVPAKDEAENVPRLLASLESQIDDFENLVFVDDLSSDNDPHARIAPFARGNYYREALTRLQSVVRSIRGVTGHQKRDKWQALRRVGRSLGRIFA